MASSAAASPPRPAGSSTPPAPRSAGSTPSSSSPSASGAASTSAATPTPRYAVDVDVGRRHRHHRHRRRPPARTVELGAVVWAHDPVEGPVLAQCSAHGTPARRPPSTGATVTLRRAPAPPRAGPVGRALPRRRGRRRRHRPAPCLADVPEFWQRLRDKALAGHVPSPAARTADGELALGRDLEGRGRAAGGDEQRPARRRSRPSRGPVAGRRVNGSAVRSSRARPSAPPVRSRAPPPSDDAAEASAGPIRRSRWRRSSTGSAMAMGSWTTTPAGTNTSQRRESTCRRRATATTIGSPSTRAIPPATHCSAASRSGPATARRRRAPRRWAPGRRPSPPGTRRATRRSSP